MLANFTGPEKAQALLEQRDGDEALAIKTTDDPVIEFCQFLKFVGGSARPDDGWRW
ncbi:hypothetical protein ACLB1Q_33225 [Escherichia coli]